MQRRPSDRPSVQMREFVHDVLINAPPVAVLDAFFNPKALSAWWQVSQSVCTPSPFGSYALQWEPTGWRDHLLGPLGGSLHGTVVEFRAGREFFIADLYWHPPEGDPVGPMALEVTCKIQGKNTLLHLRQSGHDESSARWSRYYDIATIGWLVALSALKKYLENTPR